MATGDSEERFREALARHHHHIMDALAEGSFPSCEAFLDELPDNCFEENPHYNTPRTIHVTLPVSSSPWDLLGEGKASAFREQAALFEDEPLDDLEYGPRWERIWQTELQAVQDFFAQNTALCTASKSFGDITVEAANVPDSETEFGLEDREGQPIVKIDNTYMSYPPYYGNFLTGHFADLAILADSHHKIQGQQGHLLRDLLLYDHNEDIFSADTNRQGHVIYYGDKYFDMARKPSFYTEYSLLHELAHIKNRDTDPNSPQRRAAAMRTHYIGNRQTNKLSTIMGALYRADHLPDDMVIRLINTHTSPNDVLEYLKRLDDLYTRITPAVREAAQYMEGFYNFETPFADQDIADREHNNQFIGHILDIPRIRRQYSSSFQELTTIHETLNSERAEGPRDHASEMAGLLEEKPQFDGPAKTQIKTALEELAGKHAILLQHFMTLASCARYISHAAEFGADRGMIEMAETPEKVPEVLAYLEAREGRLDPGSKRRGIQASSHVDSLKQAGSGQQEL